MGRRRDPVGAGHARDRAHGALLQGVPSGGPEHRFAFVGADLVREEAALQKSIAEKLRSYEIKSPSP